MSTRMYVLMAILFCPFSALAMEQETVVDLPARASQEILAAHNDRRSVNADVIVAWRKQYEEFMTKEERSLSVKKIQKFLRSYLEHIQEAFSQDGDSSATPTKVDVLQEPTKRYRFIYRPINNNDYGLFREINVSPNMEAFTLGRGWFNSIDLNDPVGSTESVNLSLSRIQLLLFPLRDGRVLIFDAFSTNGTELLTPEECETHSFVAKRQASVRTFQPLFLPEEGKIDVRVNASRLTIIRL